MDGKLRGQAHDRRISIFNKADCCNHVTAAMARAASAIAINSGRSQSWRPPTRMRSTNVRANAGTAMPAR